MRFSQLIPLFIIISFSSSSTSSILAPSFLYILLKKGAMFKNGLPFHTNFQPKDGTQQFLGGYLDLAF